MSIRSVGRVNRPSPAPVEWCEMSRQEMNDALVGTTIGNYKVQRKLGSGAMGMVYLGEHPEIGKRVAIKILAAHLTEDRGMVDRFQTEARAIGLLEHPGIIEMFDFGVLPDGRSYYTMEYLQGETLSHRMKRGSFTLRELYAVVEQVCDALYIVHEKGIIHRDMKPSNVFLAKKGMRTVVKILDFGIAKIQDSMRRDGEQLTSTGAVLGTPVFMSPEQALGQNDRITYLSDIYSFGVILYKILTDRFPIDGVSIPEVVTWHVLNEAIPLRSVNPQIPEPLAQVVMNCLHREPTTRYQSTAHLWEAFCAACAGLDMDWVIPTNLGRAGTMAAPIPAALSASGQHPSLGDGTGANSGSASFYPPPPPPANLGPVQYPTYPGLPVDPGSASVVGGGSFVGERKAGPGRALALGGLVALILVGGVAAWWFTRDPGSPESPTTPAKAVKTDEPKPEPRPVVTAMAPEETGKIRVRIEATPAQAVIQVKVAGQEPVEAAGTKELEFAPGTRAQVKVSAKGFVSKEQEFTVDAKSGETPVVIALEPEAAPEPAMTDPPPPMPAPMQPATVTTPVMRPATGPAMKGPTNEKIGNDLL